MFRYAKHFTPAAGVLALLTVFSVGACSRAAVAQVGVTESVATQAQTSVQAASNDDFLPQLQGVDPAKDAAAEAALTEPRRIAAAIVAVGNPSPKLIVDVDAYQGSFLGEFLNRFPTARGLWTEGDRESIGVASARLARFGDRVDFKIACADRMISEECIPHGTDVIITDWVSIHQDLNGMYKSYSAAAALLPPGGWIVNIDHIGFGGSAWEPWLQAARKGIRPDQDGPAIHHPELRVPTVDEQLGALRAAGFDAHVTWQSFNTVLFMGRKR